MEFKNIYFLIIPIILIFFYFLFLNYFEWKKKVFRMFGMKDYLDQAHIKSKLNYTKISFIAYSLSIVSIAIALAEPRIITSQSTSNSSKAEIFFAIDVSRSMLVEDVGSSRMSLAKQLIGSLSDNNNQAILSFAASAYWIVPLTSNSAYFIHALAGLSPDNYSNQGTSIVDVFDALKRIFSEKRKNRKVLIFISDGEFHDEMESNKFSVFDKKGIDSYFITIGTNEGGIVPRESNSTKSENVISSAKPSTMKGFAKSADGKHFHIQNIQDLKKIESELKEKLSTNITNTYYPLYGFFLLIAFVVLVVFWDL